MRAGSGSLRAFTLVEMLVTTALVGVTGLIIFAILNTGLVLGAKNSAVNTSHQQARVAMLQMLQHLHSAVSQPYLVDSSYNTTAVTPAAGVSFQTWSGGPYQIVADSTTAQKTVTIQYGTSGSVPNLAGKRLIVPTHGIEDTIVSNTTTDPTHVVVTLTNNLVAAISGTSSYNMTAFTTDRCYYCVVNGALQYVGPGTGTSYVTLGNSVATAAPFSLPTSANGSTLTGVVSAINLSTSDPKTGNRGFHAANILLNQRVPARAKLTTYQ